MDKTTNSDVQEETGCCNGFLIQYQVGQPFPVWYLLDMVGFNIGQIFWLAQAFGFLRVASTADMEVTRMGKVDLGLYLQSECTTLSYLETSCLWFFSFFLFSLFKASLMILALQAWLQTLPQELHLQKADCVSCNIGVNQQ